MISYRLQGSFQMSKLRLRFLSSFWCCLLCLLMASALNGAVPCSGDITSALSSAISAASDSTTISIGAGTCTLSSPISWTSKNIYIIGAGAGSTLINAPAGAFFITVSNVAKASFRLSGFTLQGTNSSNTLIKLDATSAGAWSYGWRIDHIDITYSGIVTSDPLVIFGVTYGLIDHVNFTINGGGTFILQVPYMNPEDGSTIGKLFGTYNLSLPLDLGTYKAVYIEDCTFSNGGSGNYYASFDSSEGGARVVIRHNTFQGVIYAHWTRFNEIDGIKYEIYSNVATGDAGNQVPLRLEAGTGVIFNNTISGYANQQFWIDERRGSGQESSGLLLACDGTHFWDGNIESSGWPCLGQIGRAPGYTISSALSGNHGSAAPLYAWNNGAQSGCAAGGSCTNSVLLTVSDTLGILRTTPNPHSNGDVDYVNNGSTPMPGYTPFTYPYPLTSTGLPNVSSFVAAPTSLTVTTQ
jgi:hypothetical protein